MRTRSGGFRRGERLRSSRDYRRVARSGRRRTSRSFVVLWAPAREAAESRGQEVPVKLGLTVSRKVGNAVTRNGVKRRVREWFRHHRDALPSGTDIVVIARSGAAGLDGTAVAEQLDALTRGLQDAPR